MLLATLATAGCSLVELLAPGLAPPHEPVVAPPPSPPHGGASSVGSASALIACFSNAFYAYEGVAVVLPIASQLSQPAYVRYPRTLLTAVLLVGVAFVLVGGLGGAAYPHNDSASVTTYLARLYRGTPSGDVFFTLNLLVAVAVLGTFPLQLTPAAHVFEKWIPPQVGGPSSRAAQCMARLIAVSVCGALVYALPSFNLLLDLVGALTTTTIAALPCVIHLELLRRPDTLARVHKAAARRAEDAYAAPTSTSAATQPCASSTPPLTARGGLPVEGAAVAGDGAECDDGMKFLNEVSPPMARPLVVVDTAIVLLCVAVTIAGVEQAVRALISAAHERAA